MRKTSFDIQHCTQCGAPTDYQIPEGDTRQRAICSRCHKIHYQNPHVVVGAVVHYNDCFVLCKRAIEPRHGFWTIPAGYLELEETTEAGALREAYEEAQTELEIERLLAVYNLAHLSQVQVLYLARLKGDHFAPGPESLEVACFSWDDIPWDDLAFPSVRWALLHARRQLRGETLLPETRSESLVLDPQLLPKDLL
jgi:ADP-ribose pyrophosphatase YjhB (NUDIX family)